MTGWYISIYNNSERNCIIFDFCNLKLNVLFSVNFSLVLDLLRDNKIIAPSKEENNPKVFAISVLRCDLRHGFGSGVCCQLYG